MTDNEIIKALECCSNADRITECGRCPYYRKGCLDKVHADATDLINRQKAEIERYEKIVGKLAINKDGIAIGTLNGKQTEYIQKSVAEVFRNMAVNRAKAEAVKEFAERLKATFPTIDDLRCTDDDIYTLNLIDDLVKEFTEGEKK